MVDLTLLVFSGALPCRHTESRSLLAEVSVLCLPAQPGSVCPTAVPPGLKVMCLVLSGSQALESSFCGP